MNNIKSNSIGIDSVINFTQNALYNELNTIWNNKLHSYPRCYTHETDSGKDIRYYFKSNEYQSVLNAEPSKFFFTAENPIKRIDNYQYETFIDLYFILNLDEISSITHRGDEEAIVNIVSVLESNPYIVINEILLGYLNVFKGFKYHQKNDLQPYFVCKISLKVERFPIDGTICN